MKHTKTPRAADPAQRYQLTVTVGRKSRPVMIHDIRSGNRVADVYGHNTSEDGGAPSLAHQLAAAPELLVISRRLLPSIERLAKDDSDWDADLALLRAAIRKAEGRA